MSNIKEKISQKQKKIAELKEIIKARQEEIKKLESEIAELNKQEINEVLNEYKVTSADELKNILKKLNTKQKETA